MIYLGCFGSFLNCALPILIRPLLVSGGLKGLTQMEEDTAQVFIFEWIWQVFTVQVFIFGWIFLHQALDILHWTFCIRHFAQMPLVSLFLHLQVPVDYICTFLIFLLFFIWPTVITGTRKENIANSTSPALSWNSFIHVVTKQKSCPMVMNGFRSW